MADFEYKVVAAPKKAKSFKGVRSHEDQFAAVLMEIMNELANDAWEYLRAESLPCEEKTGLTSRVESYQSVLVFRRPIAADQKFFETPPTRQIELHEIKEDEGEGDKPTYASDRPAAVSSYAEAEEPATGDGVLSLLRNRKASKLRDEMEDYPEHMKLAGE